MSEQIPYIRVFISSPGDVNAERQIALEVIDRLPYRPAFRDKVAFRVIAWDKPGADTPMRATLTPQDAINQGLPKPAECDIVVVLFWSRMGTPFTDNDGTAYQSGTHWELMNAIESKRSETVIYRRTDKPPFEFTDTDFDAKRAQYQRVQDFFNSEMFYKNGQIQRGVNSYSTPDDFREKFETHFEALVVNLLNKIAAGKPAPENLPPPTVAQQANIITIEKQEWEAGKSPFPGLVPFTADDAPIFFGRGQETDALVKQVLKSRFVAVVGASGSGKSSLVGAGLVPQLQANVIEGSKDWIIVRFTPGNEPFTALANALIDHVPALQVDDPLDYPARLKKLVGNLHDDPDYLPLMLTHALKGEKAWAEVVLFIDQFEELFTVGAAQAQAFARVMQRVAASEQVRTLVTIRADFAHQAIAIPEFSELFRDGFFALAIPRRDALRQMIERPAERAGLTVEAGLVERMLDETGNEPGNLALLAYMLDELYRLCAATGQLTQAAYDELGGIQGAIGKRSESVYAALDDAAKNVLPTVFRELVEVDERGTATRRRALLARVTGDAAMKALVNTLTNARLLVQNTDHDGNPVVEVAHEALLRNWERLKAWMVDIQDDLLLRRKVEIAAREWDASGRREDYLWSQERQDAVVAMQERLGIEFEGIVTEFLQPELDRLLEEFKDGDTPDYRKLTIIDRFKKIGIKSLPYVIDAYKSSLQRMQSNLLPLIKSWEGHSVNLLISLLNNPDLVATAIELLGDIASNPALGYMPSPFAELDSIKEKWEREIWASITKPVFSSIRFGTYDDYNNYDNEEYPAFIDDPRIVPALLRIANQPDHPARINAIRTLGQLRHSDSYDTLKQILYESDILSDTLIYALGRLQVVEALPRLLELAEQEVQQEKPRPLGARKVYRPSWTTLVSALGDLGHPDVVPVLIKWLGKAVYDQGRGIPLTVIQATKVIEALDKINSVDAIPALEQFVRENWKQSETKALEAAVSALVRTKHESILSILKDLMSHEVVALQELAFKGLLLLEDTNIVKDACLLLLDNVRSWDSFKYLIYAVGNLNSLAVNSALAQYINKTDRNVDYRSLIISLEILRQSNQLDLLNESAMILLLGYRERNNVLLSRTERKLLPYYLKKLGIYKLLAAIEYLVQSKDDLSLIHVIAGFGDFDDISTDIEDSLRTIFVTYNSREVRRKVLHILGKSEETEAIVAQLLVGDDVEFVLDAITWIGRTRARNFLDKLIPMLEDVRTVEVNSYSSLLSKEQVVQHLVIETLGEIGDENTIPYLLPYLHSVTPQVLDALKAIGHPSIVTHILSYLDSYPQKVIEVLGKIGTLEALEIVKKYKQEHPEYEPDFDFDDLFGDDDD